MARPVDAPPHLPPPNQWHETVTAWPPFPTGPGEALAPLLDRFALSGLTAIRYVCTGLWSIDPPRRVADDMFFYVLGGRGTMDVAGRRARFAAGDLLHWRRGVEHAATTDPDDPIRVISLHYTAAIDGAVHLPELFGF